MPRTFGKMREQAIGKVRRFLLLHFRKAYVAQQEKNDRANATSVATAANSYSNAPSSSKMTPEKPCAASTKTAQNNARHFQLTRGVYPKLTSTARTPLAQSLPSCK